MKGFLSIDIDVSELQVNQCSSPRSKEPLTANKYYNEIFSQIEIFHESNKCHPHSMLVSWDNFIHIFIMALTRFKKYCKIEFCIHFHTFAFSFSFAPEIIIAKCEYRPPYGRNTAWIRGAYQCLCKPGYYSIRHRDGFNGTVMEVVRFGDVLGWLGRNVFKFFFLSIFSGLQRVSRQY